MAVTKLAISLPPEVAEDTRASANELGISVSRWVTEALEQRLTLERMRRYVRLIEAESGPFTEEEVAAADARIYGDS